MDTTLGAFEVNLTPQSDEAFEAGRLLIDKTYQGGLEGKGTGQMLSARTEREGSAGYVASSAFPAHSTDDPPRSSFSMWA